MDSRPIGIFDSGLGGLSTVRALKNLMPYEDIVYFGDTGRVPYGTRSNETIETYAAQDIEFLRKFDCKMIVVACGTVSTVAADMIYALREPATGIAKPSAAASVKATNNKIIGIMGTSATINSNVFDDEIHSLDRNIKTIGVACPLLVNLVENSWISENDPITSAVIERYIKPILDANADTIILGCTHFPILAPLIQKIAGDSVTLIDTGLEEAKFVEKTLKESNTQNDASHIGEEKFFVSDKTQNFCTVANTLLGEDISDKCSFVDILKYI